MTNTAAMKTMTPSLIMSDPPRLDSPRVRYLNQARLHPQAEQKACAPLSELVLAEVRRARTLENWTLGLLALGAALAVLVAVELSWLFVLHWQTLEAWVAQAIR